MPAPTDGKDEGDGGCSLVGRLGGGGIVSGTLRLRDRGWCRWVFLGSFFRFLRDTFLSGAFVGSTLSERRRGRLPGRWRGGLFPRGRVVRLPKVG